MHAPRPRRALVVLAVALAALAVSPSLAPAAGLAPPPPAAPPAADPGRVVVGLWEMEDAVGADSFLGASVLRATPAIRTVLVEADDVEAFLASAADDPRVRWAERDVELPLALFTPNDPHWADQYGPAQVEAPLAWDTTLGDMDAEVCVLDTGVRYTHEDLDGPRWLGGIDYVNDDDDPWDDGGHGTAVAGVAVAALNNGLNVAGMANVGYRMVKVLNAGGSGSLADVADGIVWCADHGGPRTVISLSLGCECFSQAVVEAIDHAYDVMGRLVVAASGNDGCEFCVIFPANVTDVIAVGCTEEGEGVCSYSSGGPELALVAPGDHILTTSNWDDQAHEHGSGTSFSAPHVAGALALYWSHDTAIAPDALRERLRHASQDLGDAGWDSASGCGELDVKRLFDGIGLCYVPPEPPCDDTPVNDCFENATVHDPIFTRIYQSTRGAVLEPDEPRPCGEIGRTVWYRFRATADGVAWASTQYSFFDTVLAVYEGPSLDALTLLGCNDDHDGSRTSRVEFPCVAGRWYWIQAGGRANRSGGLEYRSEARPCRETTPPSEPLALAVTRGPGAGELSMTWSAPTDLGNATLRGYRVYGADTAAGPFTQIGSTDAGTRSFAESGLGNGRTRHYRVTAWNDPGEGDPSVAASNTTFVPPGPPRDLTARPGHPPFRIDLRWRAPESDGGRLDGYEIWRKDSPTASYRQVGAVGRDTTTWFDPGQHPLRAYWYEVRAHNVAGKGPFSNEACAMPVAYPAPLDACRGGLRLPG